MAANGLKMPERTSLGEPRLIKDSDSDSSDSEGSIDLEQEEERLERFKEVKEALDGFKKL